MKVVTYPCCVTLLWVAFGLSILPTNGRRHRSVPAAPADVGSLGPDPDLNPLTNTIDFIWSQQTVAAGDTAVLHCSFDAIFSQLRNGNIDWVREGTGQENELIATGKKTVIANRRFRVYRPHNSALSVLIIRRTKKRDGGIYRCNLSGSSTRHKYLTLNVTESKIEAQTSPARLKTRIGKAVTLWCNATGYPRPVVYWTREDSNRKLPDQSYQFWGNGLQITHATEQDTGIYACYLDNFVQPVVSYKFSLVVEDRPWNLDGFKMRFDSSQWFTSSSVDPKPVQGKSFLLMCETRGMPKPLPAIEWFKDGREIRSNKHFYIIEDEPQWKNSYISSTLVIMKFVPRHQANYTCTASNVFRTKTREFVIKGYDPNVESSSEEDIDNAISRRPAAVDMDFTVASLGDTHANNLEPTRPKPNNRGRKQGRRGANHGTKMVNNKPHNLNRNRDSESNAIPSVPTRQHQVENRLPMDDEDYETMSGSGAGE